MATVKTYVSILLILIANFRVKKLAFVRSDGIGLSIDGSSILNERETFVMSTLWEARRGKFTFRIRSSRQSFIGLILLLCGDIEICPGPVSERRHNPELEHLTNLRGITILHQNVRGLFANHAYICELIQSFKGIDILTLSETHLEGNGTDVNEMLKIPGYIFVSKPRPTGKGGGVTAYISENLICDQRHDLENDNLECLWFEVKPAKTKGFLLAITYRLPDTSKYFPKDFDNHFNAMLSKANETPKEIILLGDVNVNFLDSTNGKDFKPILNLFGLKHLIHKPTRITDSTSTLIDIIGTNNPVTIRDARVIPTGIGDHDMVGCVRKINLAREAPRQITCRNYRNYDPEKLKEDLRNSDWLHVMNCVDVNEAWGYMKDMLSGVLNKHAPKIQKKVKGKAAPWLDEGVKRLMNERDKVLHKFCKTRAENDQAAYKEKRNAVNVAVRKAKSSYHRKLLSENAGNPNRFWRTIKSIYPSKPNNSNVNINFEINEEQVNNPSTISNGFCSVFTNVISEIKRKAFPLRDFIWQNPSKIEKKSEKWFNFQPVTSADVEKCLKDVKRSKSTGLDDLPPGLLKDSAAAILLPLTHIINLSFSTGVFPTQWKNARIVPVHKSESKSSLDNYRPISILPVLSKTIEKLVHQQLMKFLDENRLFSEFQFGFRPKMSTELAATLFLDNIHKSVD